MSPKLENHNITSAASQDHNQATSHEQKKITEPEENKSKTTAEIQSDEIKTDEIKTNETGNGPEIAGERDGQGSGGGTPAVAASELVSSGKITRDGGRLAPGRTGQLQYMSRDAVVSTIRELAERLGHPPSIAELEGMTRVRRGKIRRYFATYQWALRECGLGPRFYRQTISTERMFVEWTAAVRKLKKVPSMKEFEDVSEITVGPYQREFRSWTRVPEAMAEYAAKHGLQREWEDVLAIVIDRRECGLAATVAKWPAVAGAKWPAAMGARPGAIRDDRPVYGAAMAWGPMLNEPINEAGVLFLFGAMAERLGFKASLIQTGFPDCEALREVSPGRCQRVRIEIEYESRNFLRHGHALDGCDMLVCWIHNWPECPLEVLELREALRRIG